jgi:hypothetical protein
MRAWKEQGKGDRKGEEEMEEYEAAQFRLKGIRPLKARLEMTERKKEKGKGTAEHSFDLDGRAGKNAIYPSNPKPSISVSILPSRI